MVKKEKSQNENFFVRFWNGDLSLPMSYWGVGVGIGFSPPKFLKSGDKVTINVTGLGSLTNSVI